MPGRRHVPVTEKRRQHPFVPKVLAPSLEFLRRTAETFAKLGKRLSEDFYWAPLKKMLKG